MKKLFYPALFHKAEEGGFWVSFPDIPECLTQGDDMEQAYEMAADALGLALVCREQEHEPLPAASDPTSISPETDSFLVVMEFDMLAYKKRTSSRAVKKTLSIPEWLNEAAMAMDLNFSQILQEALLSKIQANARFHVYFFKELPACFTDGEFFYTKLLLKLPRMFRMRQLLQRHIVL